MSDSFIKLRPDSSGKSVKTFENGGVHSQAVTLADQNGTPVKVNSGSLLEVYLRGPNTAFGDVSVAEASPVAQLDFVYGINPQVVTVSTSNGGTTSSANALGSANTAAAINSWGQIMSRRYLKYRAGQGSLARFTAVYSTPKVGANQFAGLATPNLDNGFGFGYVGTDFGIIYVNAGVQTFIPQTAWSVDKLDGNGPSGDTLIPTFGNVFQIRHQYLGFGCIQFFVETSGGAFTLVHLLQYANANALPNVSQPSFNVLWRASNTTNNTVVSVKGASAALFVEGNRQHLGPRFGHANNKASITTETSILALRVATTFNGVANRSQIALRSISFGGNASGAPSGMLTFSVWLNPTLGGSPSFSPKNGSTADNGVTVTSGGSIVSVDTAGTTVSGGTLLFNGVAAIGNSQALDVTDLKIFANPGDLVVLAITATASSTVGAAVTWSEDL